MPQLGAPPSIDASMRRPSLGPDDGALVRAPAVLAEGDTGFGLDFEIVTEPIVIHDDSLATTLPLVDYRTTLTLLYGVGVFGFAELNLALPLVFAAGDGYAALSAGQMDDVPGAALGDLSIEARAMWPDPIALGPVDLRLGASSGIRFPTGDPFAFAGDSTVTGSIAALSELSVEWFYFRLELGVRVREAEQLLDVTIGSSLTIASAAGVELFDDRLALGATMLALVGLEDSVHPIVGALEARVRAASYLDLVVAAGAGLGEAVASPGFFASAGLRAYTPEEAD
jgi:hypothetical protein